ncbi:MAG: sigma factor [Clostridia bacterium]
MTEEEFCQSVYEDRHLLYHIAYVLLHNSADCEDAVQETVCRAWQKRGALKNPASMRAWLSILDGYSGGTPGIWDHDSAAFPDNATPDYQPENLECSFQELCDFVNSHIEPLTQLTLDDYLCETEVRGIDWLAKKKAGKLVRVVPMTRNGSYWQSARHR